MLEYNKTYRIIKLDDEKTHRPQGNSFDTVQVGDIVKVADYPQAIWKNWNGTWCWAIEQNDKYGAAFHITHIEAIEAK